MDAFDSTAAAITLDQLSTGYGGPATLINVSATVPSGGLVAVVGPNGAGKSTLFKALVGLLRPYSGRVLVYGSPPGSNGSRVAYVPQREEIDWHFPVTVMDVVLMGRYGHLGWLRRPTRADREIARRCLSDLGMDGQKGVRIGSLSGGQQQRVFIARALAQEPHVLLLDEPFSGVDTPSKEAALELLQRLNANGLTLLVSTHDLALAAGHFASLLLLNRRLVAQGAPSDVLTADNLAATFGSQILVFKKGDELAAVTDQCCPSSTED